MLNRALVALIGTATLVSGVSVSAAARPADAEPQKPTLIVAISVDQFSAGLFDQYRDHFKEGLRRMIDGGVVFPNGYQSHAATETCPGHSTLLTGRHPSGTGIIANEWRGPDGKPIYCVSDPGMTVPGRAGEPRGPANLRVSTLGEWLKAQSPASRVVAVSGKDRAAINMAGHNPDAVFWWDDELGFNTYVKPGEDPGEKLAPVREFNESVEKQWRRRLPAWKPLDSSCKRLDSQGVYDSWHVDHHVPPDAQPTKLAAEFRKDKAFQRWTRASPIVDELTLQLATGLLKRYELGKRGVADILAVSLSSTDYVGHRYGNQGPEMCDQLAHLDRSLGTFLKALDATKAHYVLVLSADHGAIDAAERLQLKGVHAERVKTKVGAFVNAYLRGDNAQVRPPFTLNYDAFAYLSYGLYFSGPSGTAPAQRQLIMAAAAEYLNQQPWIAHAFLKSSILAVKVRSDVAPDEMTLEERFAESIDAERSADILIAFKPYATPDAVDANGYYISGHGSPWNYDRRVPIVFWGPGLPSYEQYLPIETVDIAPTLARLLGVSYQQVDGHCIDLDPGLRDTCQPPTAR